MAEWPTAYVDEAGNRWKVEPRTREISCNEAHPGADVHCPDGHGRVLWFELVADDEPPQETP